MANMRLLSFLTAISAILALIGCDSSVSNSDAARSSSPTATASIVTSQASSESAAPVVSPNNTTASKIPLPSLHFIEGEPDREWQELSEQIRRYEQKPTEAINANSYSTVAPYLLPDSPLEKSQKALVNNLASRGIKERYVSSEIYGYTDENGIYKVNVTESVEVTFPDKAPKVQDYKWIYTVVKRDGTFFLSQLDEWDAADFDRRAGAVKADGYYIDEFPGYFPTLLESAVNTLDLTHFRTLAPDRAVMARLKALITELRASGKEYSIKGKTVSENLNSYSYVLELSYTYVDNMGSKQSGTRKLALQLDEIRSGFSGYAIIRYLDDASNSPLLSEPEIKIYRFAELVAGKPSVLVEIHGKAEELGRSIFYQADQINLFTTSENGKKGQLLQELKLKEPTRTSIGHSLGLEIVDMNFDGTPDIRIQSSTPPGPNIPYLCWLWDPKTATFVENSTLEEITSPIFQIADKTIFSRNRGSASSHLDSTYQYVNGELALIKEVQYDYKLDKKVWHVTMREPVKGAIQVIREYDEGN